jgi:hypothetical protein
MVDPEYGARLRLRSTAVPERVVLFVNERSSAMVQGPARAADPIAAAFAPAEGLELRRVPLPPVVGWRRLAARSVPWAGHHDLDLQVLRWHLMQGAVVRTAVTDALREGGADGVLVNTHSIAIRLGEVMDDVPTVLDVDATIEQWQAFGVWRRWTPWSPALLAPSLAMERRRFGQAAAVIAQSAWAAGGVQTSCPGARVEVVHPGLDLEQWCPAAREPRDRPRLLFVGGRFASKGGHDLLLALAPRLEAGQVELDVVTVEDVPQHPGVRSHRLDAGDARLLDLFQQADLFVLPTRGEGNPWVVLEAMATATPVLSCPVGAIDEMVGPGGVLVPPGDLEALRAALEDLLEDPARLTALGAVARQEVERRYDQAVQGPRLVDVVRAAVG